MTADPLDMLPQKMVEDLVPVERPLPDKPHAWSLIHLVEVPRAEEPANDLHSERAIPPAPAAVEPDRHQDDHRERDFPGAHLVPASEQAAAVRQR